MILLNEDNGIILSVKLRNALINKSKTKNMNITAMLKNIIINGDKRGCSGFITNEDNGSIVYVNTEKGYLNMYLYRYADSTKDYRGYSNRYAETFDELVDAIIDLLKETPQEVGDYRI